jgi:flagellar biogenesis protein FliO
MRRRSLIAVVFAVATAIASAGKAQSPYPAAPALLPEAGALAPLPTTPSAPSSDPGPVRQALALSPPEARAAEPLSLPAAPSVGGGRSRTGTGSSFITVFASLGVVLGLFLAVAAFVRRGMPAPARLLPKEAVEVLGRAALPGRRQGHLIRVGNKIALVSFSTSGTDTLVEITDPAEVDRLAGLCLQDHPQSATTSFRGIVEQFFKDRPESSPSSRRRAEADDA